MLGLFL